jgi:Zn-dependent alcohol dehydrogenase
MGDLESVKWIPSCRGKKICSKENHARCECGRRALFRSRGKKGNHRLHSDKRHHLCANCYKRHSDAQAALSVFPARPAHPPRARGPHTAGTSFRNPRSRIACSL